VLHIGNELLVYGCKPADYGPPGFPRHSRYVLVIIDEAGGVPKLIFDAVDALATTSTPVVRPPRSLCGAGDPR
jgi:hypothetical protein